MTRNYDLAFISNESLFEHVKQTVLKYRHSIDLKEFNKNFVDPVKLTFDHLTYGKSIQEIVESECIRQIDKSNTNHIGYFHQNIFAYFNDWEVPEKGFDAVNRKENLFAEIKNKHNTMNSASSQKIYSKMQHKILRDDTAICYLVEIIAKKSANLPWTISLDGEQISHKNIRRISIDKFYEIATGSPTGFRDLCKVLPQVIDDVIQEQRIGKIENSVFKELSEISPSLLKSIFLLSFSSYEGFDDFTI